MDYQPLSFTHPAQLTRCAFPFLLDFSRVAQENPVSRVLNWSLPPQGIMGAQYGYGTFSVNTRSPCHAPNCLCWSTAFPEHLPEQNINPKPKSCWQCGINCTVFWILATVNCSELIKKEEKYNQYDKHSSVHHNLFYS